MLGKNNMTKIKKAIDIAMTVLFIILMGYHITGNKVHEILGIATFIFFLAHNVLNIKWYKMLFKGKYNSRRLITVIVNTLLLISMLGSITSGIMISNTLCFLNIPTTSFGRSLHMASTSWLFVLMSIHMGLHLNTILFKLNKNMKDSVFEYIYYFIIFALCAYGLYIFVSTGLWKDMFLITEFKFFDYEQLPILFYIEYFAIVCSISFITHLLSNMKKRNPKVKS